MIGSGNFLILVLDAINLPLCAVHTSVLGASISTSFNLSPTFASDQCTPRYLQWRCRLVPVMTAADVAIDV